MRARVGVLYLGVAFVAWCVSLDGVRSFVTGAVGMLLLAWYDAGIEDGG